MKFGVQTAVAVVLLSAAVAMAVFTGPRNVSNTEGLSAAPSVALDGTVEQFVVWSDNTDQTGAADVNFWLRFASFPPGGTPATSQVIPNTASPDESLLPRGATDVSNGKLHVVYQSQILNRYDVFITTYNGTGWSTPDNLSQNAGDSITPAVAVDSLGRVHVVWADDTAISGAPEILYRKWSPGCTQQNPTTCPVQNVSLRNSRISSSFPDVAVTSDNRANVVWLETTSGATSVFFARQGSAGTFPTKANVSGELFTGPVADTGPSIAVGPGNRLHLVWTGVGSLSGTEIFYQTAPGTTFGFGYPRNVSNNVGISTAPRVAADSVNQAHVVWGDNVIDPDYDIYYAKVFPDGGSTVPVAIEVTNGRSMLPDIKIDVFDRLRVCWQDDQSDVPTIESFEIVCSDGTESVPPVTTATVNPPPDSAGFVKVDPATVTLTATDNSGSVADITYAVDLSAQVTAGFGDCPTSPPFSTSFAVSGQGPHQVTFYASDCDGNVEAQKTLQFGIDSIPPQTTIIPKGSCTQCPLFSTPVEVTIAASDPSPGSGVKRTTLSVDGGTATTYSGPFLVAADGCHSIKAFSEDHASNCEVTPCDLSAAETVTFEIRRPLTVDITRPKKGAFYMNDFEVIGPLIGFNDSNVMVGGSSVTVGNSPIVIGNQLTVQANVQSPDGVTVIDYAVLYVDGVQKAVDGTDKPSGSTYSFTYGLGFPVLKGTQVLKVEAFGKPLPACSSPTPVPRRGSATMAFILTQ